MSSDSILEEAHQLVYGDRSEQYGGPFLDFGRTAGMINALFQDKLKKEFTREDIAMLMICVKLSRTMNKIKRDSIVDIAGYAETLWLVVQERARREGCAVTKVDVHEMQFAAKDAGVAIPKDSSVTQN
jgi:hypothetical protein